MKYKRAIILIITAILMLMTSCVSEVVETTVPATQTPPPYIPSTKSKTPEPTPEPTPTAATPIPIYNDTPAPPGYLNIVFIGNSLIGLSLTAKRFDEIAQLYNRKVKTYNRWVAEASLTELAQQYASGQYNDLLECADIVILQEAGGLVQSETKDAIEEFQELFNERAIFYFLPISFSTNLDDASQYEISGIGNIQNINSFYTAYYMLEHFSYDDLTYRDNRRPNMLYGLALASTIYFTIFNHDNIETLFENLDSNIIPGETEEEEAEVAKHMKEAVKKALEHKR
ncbi:MAG TPA: hypothetical protein PLZ84_06490 [Clostridia bacterium]|nr:hypothetical protein [Clostridia bacterium]